MQVENAAIGYSEEEVLSAPIDLDVRRKDAIALVGPNGIGKSTLLKSLIHKIPFIQGKVHLAPMSQSGTMTKLNPICIQPKRSSMSFGMTTAPHLKSRFAIY